MGREALPSVPTKRALRYQRCSVPGVTAVWPVPICLSLKCSFQPDREMRVTCLSPRCWMPTRTCHSIS